MPYPKLIPCNPDLSQFLGKVPLRVRVYLLLRFGTWLYPPFT